MICFYFKFSITDALNINTAVSVDYATTVNYTTINVNAITITTGSNLYPSLNTSKSNLCYWGYHLENLNLLSNYLFTYFTTIINPDYHL